MAVSVDWIFECDGCGQQSRVKIAVNDLYVVDMPAGPTGWLRSQKIKLLACSQPCWDTAVDRMHSSERRAAQEAVDARFSKLSPEPITG